MKLKDIFYQLVYVKCFSQIPSWKRFQSFCWTELLREIRRWAVLSSYIIVISLKSVSSSFKTAGLIVNPALAALSSITRMRTKLITAQKAKARILVSVQCLIGCQRISPGSLSNLNPSSILSLEWYWSITHSAEALVWSLNNKFFPKWGSCCL